MEHRDIDHLAEEPQASKLLRPETGVKISRPRRLAGYGYDFLRYPLLTQLPDNCYFGRYIVKNLKTDAVIWLDMEEKMLLWGARHYPELADFFQIDRLSYQHPSPIAYTEQLLGASGSRPRPFPITLNNCQHRWSDSQKNTAIHLAIANRHFESINFLVALDQNLINIKNSQGETAADWFRVYVDSRLNLEVPKTLELLPEAIKEGSIANVEKLLKNGVSTKLRFTEGNTLLHLAIQSKQLLIAKLILQYTPTESVSELWHMKNMHGVTPKGLISNSAILGFLQTSVLFPIQSPIMNNSTDFLSISITNEMLKNISKELSAIRDKNDFEKFTSFLPTLCQVGYLICRQSCELLKNETTPESARSLLNELFNGEFTIRDKFQLRENIHNVFNYLKGLLQQNRVNQVIKLSSEKSYAAWAYRSKGIIYLNLLSSNMDFAFLIESFIHEPSHVVNSSYDISYCDRMAGNSWEIDFSGCKRLTKEINNFEDSMSEGWSDLLRIQYLLEGEDLSLNSWLAHRNADTFTVAVLGLVALSWGCATLSVEHSRLSINGNRFLQALADYSSGKMNHDPTRRKILKIRRIMKDTASQASSSPSISTTDSPLQIFAAIPEGTNDSLTTCMAAMSTGRPATSFSPFFASLPPLELAPSQSSPRRTVISPEK